MDNRWVDGHIQVDGHTWTDVPHTSWRHVFWLGVGTLLTEAVPQWSSLLPGHGGGGRRASELLVNQKPPGINTEFSGNNLARNKSHVLLKSQLFFTETLYTPIYISL